VTAVDRRALQDIDAHLADLVRTEIALGPLTTYRVGGAARRFANVETDADLVRVADVVARTGVDVVVVGKGSNLLVADAGFDGLALSLGDAFAGVGVSGTTVRAGAAAALPVVARRTVAAGLTGFEWAVGVPGSIGGAVRMNAGGHGSDMAASLARVRVVDLVGGEDGVVTAADLQLEYRSSTLAPHHVVAWAEIELEPGDRSSSEDEVAAIVRWRRANQPGGQNAGSVFTNPPGRSAGQLVDAAGLKGLRVGSAQVSTKHANFIQADEGGSADEVWALTAEVRRRVHAHSGVVLHPETRTVGLAPLAELEP